MFSLTLLFSVLFSIVITSLGEARAASRTIVCISCMRYFLISSLPLGVRIGCGL